MIPLFSVPELDSKTVDRQGFAMRIKRVDQDLLDTLLRSHLRTLHVIPYSLHTSPQSSYRFIEEIEAQVIQLVQDSTDGTKVKPACEPVCFYITCALSLPGLSIYPRTAAMMVVIMMVMMVMMILSLMMKKVW